MLRRLVSQCIVLSVMVACASAPRTMTYYPNQAEESRRIVWPPAPELARLRYAGQLIGESNFMQDGGAGTGTRFLNWIAGLGGGDASVVQLIRPQSGTVDSVGRILVTDAGLQAVMVFDESTATLDIWDDAGSGTPLNTPVGIAQGTDGRFYVADAGLGLIVVFSPEGRPVEQIGAAELGRPTGLAIDGSNGHIYVADSGMHDVKVFDGNRLVETIGGPGVEAGQFNGPTHLSFREGLLYVTDTLNARVQVLSPSGDPLQQVGRRGLYVGNLVRPKGVTTDPDGNIYVIESYFDHLLVFDKTGRLLMPIGGSGAAVGQFVLPSGAWSDDLGRIFIADMFNGRVVILQYVRS